MRDEPELWPENALYLRAFGELSSSRPIGFGGIGAIPISEIESWGRIEGVSDRRLLLRMVRACDAVFMEWQADQMKRKREAGR